MPHRRNPALCEWFDAALAGFDMAAAGATFQQRINALLDNVAEMRWPQI